MAAAVRRRDDDAEDGRRGAVEEVELRVHQPRVPTRCGGGHLHTDDAPVSCGSRAGDAHRATRARRGVDPRVARLFARECRIRETQQKRARALLVKSGAAETAETVKARLQKRRNDHLVDPTKIYIRAVVVQLIAIEREQTQLIRKLAQVSRDHRTAGPTERRSLGSGSAAWRNLEADVLTRVQFPSVTQMETTVKVGGCFESAMIIQ